MICSLIPLYIYGFGVANASGRTEDLFTIAFATYQANVLTHHFHLFITMRNYTKWLAVTCTMAILFMWPIMIMYSNLTSEYLMDHLGFIMFDQIFY